MNDLVLVTLRSGSHYLFTGNMEEIQHQVAMGQYVYNFYPFQNKTYINTIEAFDRSILDDMDQMPRDSIPCDYISTVEQYTEAPLRSQVKNIKVDLGTDVSTEDTNVDLTPHDVDLTKDEEPTDSEPTEETPISTEEQKETDELNEENAHIYQDITAPEEPTDSEPTEETKKSKKK